MVSSSSCTSSRAARALAACAWAIVLLGSAALAAASDGAGGVSANPPLPGFSPPTAPPPAIPADPPRPAPRAHAAAAPLTRKILRPPGVGGEDSGIAGGGGVGGVEARPNRMSEGCAGPEDIAIYQGHTTPLPNGVPAYRVDVVNRCASDDGACAIAGIHVRCGWFSSVSLVDPRKFRRVRHNDCLLNDGRPLLAGETISFEYANSFPYRLSVAVATCVDPNASP
ncbi:hypothetical protein ACP70R_033080 [Stipagrostis hirtigluma subsp. patula]